jgi:hypothetical protein
MSFDRSNLASSNVLYLPSSNVHDEVIAQEIAALLDDDFNTQDLFLGATGDIILNVDASNHLRIADSNSSHTVISALRDQAIEFIPSDANNTMQVGDVLISTNDSKQRLYTNRYNLLELGKNVQVRGNSIIDGDIVANGAFLCRDMNLLKNRSNETQVGFSFRISDNRDLELVKYDSVADVTKRVVILGSGDAEDSTTDTVPWLTFGSNTSNQGNDFSLQGKSQWVYIENTNSLYSDYGNVGIGTTEPQGLLDVVGDANIINSGEFYVKGVKQPIVDTIWENVFGYDTTAGISGWETHTILVTNAWDSVVWSPELSLFAAVAYSGTGNRVMTSPDGINWTTRATPADNSWFGITWASELSLFVAVAGSGSFNRVMTSSNGITWVTRSTPNNHEYRNVAWSPELSLFAAVSRTGTTSAIMTSPNGINWTSRSTPSKEYFAITWSADLSLFVAVTINNGTTTNCVATSSNGTTWVTRNAGNSNSWRSVAWSPQLGLFAAVAALIGSGNRAMTSPDGINWTTRSTTNNEWYEVRWAAEVGLFVASGRDAVMTSSDGVTWTTRSIPVGEWRSVAWAPELSRFAAIGMDEDRVVTSGNPVSVGLYNLGSNLGINVKSPQASLHVRKGDFVVSGNILPSSNDAYDLGSSNMRFRELFVDSNTVYLGNVRLAGGEDGLEFIDNDTGNQVGVVLDELRVDNEVIDLSEESSTSRSLFIPNIFFNRFSNAVGIGATQPTSTLEVAGTVTSLNYANIPIANINKPGLVRITNDVNVSSAMFVSTPSVIKQVYEIGSNTVHFMTGDAKASTRNKGILDGLYDDTDSTSNNLASTANAAFLAYQKALIADDVRNRLTLVPNSSNIYRTGRNASHTWQKQSDNKTLLTVDGGGNLLVTGALESMSDVRLKSDIETIANALDVIHQLRGTRYTRKDTQRDHIGFIAQEVEQVVPEVVHTDPNTGIKSIAYDKLTALAIQALNELDALYESTKKV